MKGKDRGEFWGREKMEYERKGKRRIVGEGKRWSMKGKEIGEL